VFERRGLYPESQVERRVMKFPGRRKAAAKLPLAAAALAAVIIPVPLAPVGAGAPRPDDLRVGTNQRVGAPALLFHSMPRIEQRVLAPAIGNGKSRSLNGRQRHRSSHAASDDDEVKKRTPAERPVQRGRSEVEGRKAEVE